MTTRADLVEKIVRIKIEQGLSWAELAGLVPDLSKEFVTAALLGQMTLPKVAAEAIGDRLGLDPFEIKLLQVPPYRGSLPTAVPTDPLIYRFYELISGVRHHLQGADPRGVRRRHHERHRLSPCTCRASRTTAGDRVAHHHERQVPALQILLNPAGEGCP